MLKISLFSLYKRIIKNYYMHNSFVLFKKPYEKKIIFYSHYNKNYVNNKFFLIKDFDDNFTIKIYPKKIYYTDIQKYYSYINYFIPNFWEKHSSFLTYSNKYKKLIEKGVEYIKKGYFKKVVLSRYIKIHFHKFYLKETLQRLILYYPNALVYLWYDIHHGFWIGSSPELLIKCKKKKLKTVALAGTTWGENKWTKKEIEEHHIVIKYIVNFLKFYDGYIFLEKTKVIKTGNLKHLETPISFSFFKEPDYYEIINKLYPTPSICGFPKKTSLDFIKENEGYKRNFYTGYIGVINEKNMELYLNLRCATIKEDKKKIILYAGSGITINSNVNQEYIETEKKIKNILSQLIFK
ncbi:chorismate-binding protein [Blattabacterium cuenoti]|uniref:chorismate-binding protein n=1 Tax=Blattabacterium cuenoti TaxID=1653831 RepID=UPI00163B9C3C|nr:chorismate-binding protein [Blattabacterium cuenoti]